MTELPIAKLQVWNDEGPYFHDHGEQGCDGSTIGADGSLVMGEEAQL